MDGWYEWRPSQTEKKTKTPFYMYADDGELLFMAGLWSTWRPAGAPRETRPAGELHDHHHRVGRAVGADP